MVKILLMRHSESIYNAQQSQYVIDNNLDDPHYELASNRWIINEQIIDAGLSPKGEQQSYSATEVLNNYKDIKYVWVSPLRRAFYTMTKTLENYKYKENIQKYIVNPYIKEVAWSNCDMGLFTHKLREENPSFDWTCIDKFEDPRIWFLEIIDEAGSPENQELKHKLIEAWKKDPQVKTLLDILESVFPLRAEGEKSIEARVNKAKEQLNEFIKENNVQDNELLVVSHSQVLKRWTTTKVDEDGNPSEFYWFNNAEIKEFELKA